ncbi:MAG: FAD-binding oxidoreductase [Candidatus Fermentibacteraceae bacterium]|nr:FAD-binding oxidoreductase [Candidatus Fermentibacteraceae bacterium]
MKIVKGTRLIQNEYPDLLKDESSLSGGNCQLAAWPENLSKAASFIKECAEDRVPLTISGERTGITGGAVPMGGAVVSTSLMKGIKETDKPHIITVGAGETLDSILEFCQREKPEFFYPPDPTETTASIGGTIATDASGAGSYLYGSTRNWINRIVLVLPSGKQLEISRGDYFFRKGRLSHPVIGSLMLPSLARAQPAKNAAGLYIRPDMDLIDLFIGSEGKLGLVAEADLILHKRPHAITSFAVFCSEKQFWELRTDLMNTKLRVRELEVLAEPCLSFLQENTGQTFTETGDWVLVTSIEASSEEELDTILETLDVLLEGRGVSPDNTWGGFDSAQRKKLKEFRHLVPETVNRIISALSVDNHRIHKVSTDTAVKPEDLLKYYTVMRKILKDSGVQYIVFGHSGQGHLHANLIPVNTGELESAMKAVELIAAEAVGFGGTVSAEHGTGKLKAPLLKLMYSEQELNEMSLLVQNISLR